MKLAILLITLLLPISLMSQSHYDENEPITNYPTGLYYQYGPGSNNSDNWTYPYGTKLTINHGLNRNFELSSIGKSNAGYVVRQFDPHAGNWTSWRQIILDDGNGNISLSTGKYINFGLEYSKIFENNTDRLVIQGHNGIALQSYHGPSQTLHTDLFAQYGQVGIGTSSPSEKLDVDGNIEMSGNNRYMRTHHWNYLGSAGSGYGYFGMAMRYRNDQWESFHSSINGMALRFIGNGVEFITAPPNTTPATVTSLMTVKSSGNVAVQGKLEAKEVKVLNAPTADFVFESDYQLRPLNEVENYVKTNKHLPDVPSGKEIEDEGLDVGEMNARLLQKVEELTLYMIEQNKQNEALQEKVEKLEKEVSVLKNE